MALRRLVFIPRPPLISKGNAPRHSRENSTPSPPATPAAGSHPLNTCPQSSPNPSPSSRAHQPPTPSPLLEAPERHRNDNDDDRQTIDDLRALRRREVDGQMTPDSQFLRRRRTSVGAV